MKPFETTRGCPYSCTYCEIGTKYYQKIKHKLSKIYAEIDWMAKNKVVFVYNADSNFGTMKEHLDITKYLVNKKATEGYLQKHRCIGQKISLCQKLLKYFGKPKWTKVHETIQSTNLIR